MTNREHTALSFQPGHPRHNVDVFRTLWGHDALWINDDGTLFETGESSGGNVTFADLVEDLRALDKHKLLSREDAIVTIAMLYHMLPSQEPSKGRDEVFRLVRELTDRLGREPVKSVVDRYAETFGKVRDNQLAALWEDLKDLEKGRL
ncbi:MAG TPA: hypothetical protein VG757_07140 [Devosia sp.]|nr:hypothetical protein [Devosia sp.]